MRLLSRRLLAVLALALLSARASAAPEGLTAITAEACQGGPKGTQGTVYTSCPVIDFTVLASAGLRCDRQQAVVTPNTKGLFHMNSRFMTDSTGGNSTSVFGCCLAGCASCNFNDAATSNGGDVGNHSIHHQGYWSTCSGGGGEAEFYWEINASTIRFDNRSFSIEFWVRGRDVGYEPTLLKHCPNSGAQNQCLWIHQGNGGDDGKLHVVWGGPTNTELTSDASWAAGLNAGLDDGNFHYVVFTYDASTKIRTIYIDGDPRGQDNAPTGQHYQGGASLIQINRDGGAGSNCAGTAGRRDMDELRFLEKALSWAEIRARYYGSHHFYAINGANQPPSSLPCTDTQTTPYSSQSQPTSPQFNTSGTNQLQFRTYGIDESLTLDNGQWTLEQTTLPTPPAPRVDINATTINTVKWDWDPVNFSPAQPRYVCDSGLTVYSLTLDGGFLGTTGGKTLSWPFFSSNTQHCLKIKATYTDTGCSGVAVPSGDTAQACRFTLARVPSTPAVSTAISGTAVNVTLGLNGNADPTPINVESNGSGSYQEVSSFQNVSPTNRAVTGLAKSQRHFFKSRAVNGDGIQTAQSGQSASSYVTMPETPTGFNGGASQLSACPKTTIRWTWNSVIAGSGGAPVYEVRNTGNSSTLCSATDPTLFCETNPAGVPSPSGISQSAILRAVDTGISFPNSDPTGVLTASTASSEIPQVNNLTGTPITPGIQWDWTAPPFLCSNGGGWSYVIDFRHVPNAVLPSVTLTGNPSPQYIQVPMSPNTKSVIAVTAFDSVDVGGSPLSLEATQYSNANPPTGLTAVQVSSTQIVVIWSANSNPNYTRYQTEISANGGSSYDIHQSLANNFTVLRDTFTGLTPGASYIIRVRAYNGRGGESFSAPTAYDQITQATMNTPPVLVGTPNSQTQVTWTWNHISNANFYQLYDARTNTQIGANINGPFPPVGSPITRTQTIAAGNPNTQLSAYVWVYNASGLATTSATSYVYTDPAAPGAASWTGQSSTTVSLAWGANNNPNPGTIYEVNVSTDPLFRVVVSTRSFMALAATVRDLFPASTYYGRVRAYSGSGVLSAFTTIQSGGNPLRRITDASAPVTLSASPSSVYVAEGSVRGLWQFDDEVRWTFPGFSLEHSSTTDASDHRNHARPTCTAAICTSTPTFTAGMPTLSTAIAFGGQVGSHVFVPHIAAYDGPGSLTIAAWVKPATVAQQDGTTLVVRQSRLAGFDWALDLKNTGTGAVYRFRVGASEVTAPASAITAGAWQRVVGVYNAVAGTINIAVDGTLYTPTAGVAARTAKADGHITFGNRERFTTAWNFDRGFIGSLDSIKLLSQAWTGTDITNDYNGSFSATVVPMPGVTLSLAPNAFGGLATIYASDDPVNHPLAVDPVTVANGLLITPTGYVLVPDSLVEIVPAVGGLPFSGNMGSTATITMTYADANNDDLLDGINPPLSANTLQMYTLDTTVTRWVALPTTVDRQAKTVTGVTPHFSIFAVFGANTIGTNVSQIKIYPNPWRRGSGGRYDAPVLTFDNLPTSGRIRIFTLAGERVADLSFSGPSAGTMTWDGRNLGGRNIASGVYFAHIKADDGSVSVIKFAVER